MSVVSNANIPGYDLIKMPGMSGQQKELLSTLIGKTQAGIGGGLDITSRLAGGDESMFAQREAPALRQFQEQIMPQIASRFAGQGALKSSAFQNVAAGRGMELAESLQAQRQDIQRQSLQQLLGLSQSLLGQRPDQYGLQEQSQGFWGQLGSGLGQGLGAGAGGLFSLLGLL